MSFSTKLLFYQHAAALLLTGFPYLDVDCNKLCKVTIVTSNTRTGVAASTSGCGGSKRPRLWFFFSERLFIRLRWTNSSFLFSFFYTRGFRQDFTPALGRVSVTFEAPLLPMREPPEPPKAAQQLPGEVGEELDYFWCPGSPRKASWASTSNQG